MKHTAIVLIALTLTSALLACGSGGGNGGTGDVVSPGEDATALEGEWLKACGPIDSAFPDDGYDIVVINFSGNTFISSIENYTDSNCTTPFAPSPNPTSSGVFTIGDTIQTTNGVEATETDSRIEEFNGAPFDIEEFTIFYIDGDNLYFGDDRGANDASTPALRPMSLDFQRVFVRQ